MRHGHCKISPLCPRTEPEEDDEKEGLFRANAVNEEEEEEEEEGGGGGTFYLIQS